MGWGGKASSKQVLQATYCSWQEAETCLLFPVIAALVEKQRQGQQSIYAFGGKTNGSTSVSPEIVKNQCRMVSCKVKSHDKYLPSLCFFVCFLVCLNDKFFIQHLSRISLNHTPGSRPPHHSSYLSTFSNWKCRLNSFMQTFL